MYLYPFYLSISRSLFAFDIRRRLFPRLAQWGKCSASKLLTEGCRIIRSSTPLFPGHFTSADLFSPPYCSSSRKRKQNSFFLSLSLSLFFKKKKKRREDGKGAYLFPPLYIYNRQLQ